MLLLLNGLDEQRTKYDAKERFRRHGLKKVKSVECEKLAGLSVCAQYKQRMSDAFHNRATVWNLGQYAGPTSGACFWLSLAAGLAECSADVLAQALPGGHRAQTLLAELRGKPLAIWMATTTPLAKVQRSALGLCAEALRRHFCDGPDAVLLRPDMQAKIYPAFAGLDIRGPSRTEQLYQRWVQKLATHEYADELVVLAVALELHIRIVVVPYTPAAALVPWAIATYGSPEITADQGTTIYFGNNDVHYVYISLGS